MHGCGSGGGGVGCGSGAGIGSTTTVSCFCSSESILTRGRSLRGGGPPYLQGFGLLFANTLCPNNPDSNATIIPRITLILFLIVLAFSPQRYKKNRTCANLFAFLCDFLKFLSLSEAVFRLSTIDYFTSSKSTSSALLLSAEPLFVGPCCGPA